MATCYAFGHRSNHHATLFECQWSLYSAGKTRFDAQGPTCSKVNFLRDPQNAACLGSAFRHRICERVK